MVAFDETYVLREEVLFKLGREELDGVVVARQSVLWAVDGWLVRLVGGYND